MPLLFLKERGGMLAGQKVRTQKASTNPAEIDQNTNPACFFRPETLQPSFTESIKSVLGIPVYMQKSFSKTRTNKAFAAVRTKVVQLVRFLVVESAHPGLSSRLGTDIYIFLDLFRDLTGAILSLVDDVPVDS
jgi:hypothetical protein